MSTKLPRENELNMLYIKEKRKTEKRKSVAEVHREGGKVMRLERGRQGIDL